MEDFPFSPKGPPVSLLVPCMPVKWESSGGCAAPLPASRTAVGPVEIKRFLPYGCTNLRMTELPFLGKALGEQEGQAERQHADRDPHRQLPRLHRFLAVILVHADTPF